MAVKIHLITYGNRQYKHQRILFKHLAEDSKFFDSIKVFTPFDLDKKFKIYFENILSIQKGNGYWIWKPYLLKKTMELLADDDILFYCDAGCLINKLGKERFYYYIGRLYGSKTGCLSFELPYKEVEYTKQEVFDYFKCDDKIRTSKQLVGGVLLFRKCPHSISLINSFYTTLYDNPLLFIDKRDFNIQDKQFIDHRHDQSVFSIIRKQFGTDLLADETYFNNFLEDGIKYPIWATRINDISLKRLNENFLTCV
jgi:hypothetical protein